MKRRKRGMKNEKLGNRTLYDLWRYRGYTKKEAQVKAEKDYKEMHRKKSEAECHQIMNKCFTTKSKPPLGGL